MMEKYRFINSHHLNDEIDILYKELLEKKEQFMFFRYGNRNYALTKEKSMIPIEDTKTFLANVHNDIYYQSIVKNDVIHVKKKDLELYKCYIEKFKKQLTHKKYNDTYYFGCVAVKTNKGFITTIRGKRDFNEYTFVENVDHTSHTIHVFNKKATLNAPLLDNLFQNTNVKAIVHLHEFDNSLPFYTYAFPGTVRDSIRNNSTSFNIMYHGVIYLFDQNGNIL